MKEERQSLMNRMRARITPRLNHKVSASKVTRPKMVKKALTTDVPMVCSILDSPYRIITVSLTIFIQL